MEELEGSGPAPGPAGGWRRAWDGVVRPLLLCAAALAGVLLLAFGFTLGLGAIPGVRLELPPEGQAMPAPTFVALAVATDVSLFLVAILAMALSPAPLRLVVDRRSLWPLPIGLLGVGATNAVGSFTISRLGEPYLLPSISGPLQQAAVLAVAVAMAPACEELFFREVLLARVLAPSPRLFAVVVSSALFGALHFSSGGMALLATLFVMGLVLAWLRLRTRSLGPPILVHAANNLLALLLVRLLGP